MNLAGHNEYHATRPMYEVPFILWVSEAYRKINSSKILDIEKSIGRKYNLEDFIHSFSDLNDINFEGFEKSESIFNPGFKEKTRWIKKGIDYDNR